MWNKKRISNRVDRRLKNGKLVTHRIPKNYIQRGKISRMDDVFLCKLKHVGRAIVTGHIHMTDDQIANTVIYNQ